MENSERGGREKEVGKEGESKGMRRKRKGGRERGKKEGRKTEKKVTVNYSGVNKLLFS